MSFFGKKREYDLEGMEDAPEAETGLPEDIEIDKPVSSHNKYKLKPKLPENPVRLKDAQEGQRVEKSPESESGYTVDDALALLKTLPVSEKLVVDTVIMTLQSANIDIEAMLRNAEERKTNLEKNNQELENQIRHFESEIVKRKNQLSRNHTYIEDIKNLQLHFGGYKHLKSDFLRVKNEPLQESQPSGELLREVLLDVKNRLEEDEKDTAPTPAFSVRDAS